MLHLTILDTEDCLIWHCMVWFSQLNTAPKSRCLSLRQTITRKRYRCLKTCFFLFFCIRYMNATLTSTEVWEIGCWIYRLEWCWSGSWRSTLNVLWKKRTVLHCWVEPQQLPHRLGKMCTQPMIQAQPGWLEHHNCLPMQTV